jgi:glutamate/tyrosine decarboxylase-like PLP-dependent enzyme
VTAERPSPVTDLDWDAERSRAFGDKALDLWQELLERLPDLPVSGRWTAKEIRDAVAIDVPDAPMSDDALFDYLHEVIFERSELSGHPRFMAYISGAGTVPGAVSDLLAAGLNANVGGWQLSPAASEIELHLMRWFAAEVFGFPEGSGGLVLSGGAMANFVGLKTARDHRAGWNVRSEGLSGHPPLSMYMSTETHVVSSRGADMLGIGTEGVRRIPVDDDYRIRTDALRAAIDADRLAGRVPIAVVASAGTVATGAIDPIPEIAEICAEQDLWLHVDAAYGGPALLADDLRPSFTGIERADSIAFDPLKWLYTPLAGGCLVVRRMAALAESFDADASYIVQDKEYTQHGLDLGRHGPQFSRSFWALKVWVSLLAHGRQAYARRISHDAALARYMGARAEERPEFELSAPVGLSICCFRYAPPDLPAGDGRDAYLDELNHRLMTEIQLDGRVYISNAVLGERFVLRACIVNFRTEADDVDAVLDVAAELGAALDAELRPAALGGAA